MWDLDSRPLGQHLSSPHVRGLLRFLDQRWDVDTVDRLLVDAGLSRALAERSDGRFSIYFQRTLSRLIAQEADCRGEDVVALWQDAGRFRWAPEVLGVWRGVLRSVGTPRSVLRQLPRLLPRRDGTIQLAVLDDAPDQMTVSLRPTAGAVLLREDVVVSVHGMLEAVPTVWGLPMARVKRRDVPGSDGLLQTVYTVRYIDSVPRLPLSGLAAAAGLGGLSGVLLSVGAGLVAGAIALAAVLLVQSLRQGRSLRRASCPHSAGHGGQPSA